MPISFLVVGNRWRAEWPGRSKYLGLHLGAGMTELDLLYWIGGMLLFGIGGLLQISDYDFKRPADTIHLGE